MNRNILPFITGVLFCALAYMLLIKPGDKELPTIWDTAAQEQTRIVEDRKIDSAESKIETVQKKTFRNNEKRNKVFADGLSDHERDSIVWAIHRKRRKADSIRNAEGL